MFSGALFVIIYFLNQSTTGTLIGHYGASTHLRFSVGELTAAVWQYVFKILLFSPFWPDHWQDEIGRRLTSSLAVYVAGIAILIWLAAAFYLLRRNGPVKVFAVGSLLFLLFVFPVLNLYFPTYIYIHADRYCYLPSIFLWPVILWLCFQFLTRGGILISAAFALISIVCLSKLIGYWHQAGEMRQQLIENFSWNSGQNVYILNVPDNFNGAYIFRSRYESPIKLQLTECAKRQVNANLLELYNYNLVIRSDSVLIQSIDTNTLNVSLTGAGWWWGRGDWYGGYENEVVRVQLAADNRSYQVSFKQRRPTDVYLYQANLRWVEIKSFAGMID